MPPDTLTSARQPVASQSWSISEVQYQRMLEVARTMDWHFAVALVLAHETGHRIGTIRKLRWEDSIQLDVMSWRQENDQIGVEHQTPLALPAIGVLQKTREMNPDSGEPGTPRIPTSCTNRCDGPCDLRGFRRGSASCSGRVASSRRYPRAYPYADRYLPDMPVALN